MLKEFKEFAMKGNMIDMAVGIIIGAAFGAIISSLVDDVFMPIIGLLVGGIDFSSWTLALSEEVTLNIGNFINAIVKFIAIAFALFMLVRGINKMKKKEEAAPAKPATPPAQEVLLGEIRDLLAKAKK